LDIMSITKTQESFELAQGDYQLCCALN
jgi:hypothetical protein